MRFIYINADGLLHVLQKEPIDNLIKQLSNIHSLYFSYISTTQNYEKNMNLKVRVKQTISFLVFFLVVNANSVKDLSVLKKA